MNFKPLICLCLLMGGCLTVELPELDDSGGEENIPVLVVNHPPVANAGDDVGEISGKLVVLNGTNSYDEDRDRLLFMWRQTSGSPVVLVDGFSSAPRFFAPNVTETQLLEFELLVHDSKSLSLDSVLVTIWPG